MFRLAWHAQHGSDYVTVTSESQEVMIAASVFYEDPLWSITEGAIKLMQGVDAVTMEWAAEPGIYHWSLIRSGDQLSVDHH